MSLVVGYAAPDIGFLVADTLISFPTEKYNPRKPDIEKFHALKIQILTPEIAVAFAGEVEASLQIIRHLQRDLIASPNLPVSQRLFDLRQKSRADCEFLALILGAGGKRLSRVTCNGIDHARRAYIGDPVEYTNFRSLTKDYEGPEQLLVQNPAGTFEALDVTPGEKEFDQVSIAMERLTHRKTSETVGAICGCVTRVVDARIARKLEYLQAVEYGVTPEEGRTGYSLLASNHEVRGVGIYYYGWKAGVLFIVADSVPCRRENAETLKKFVRLAKGKYGLNLEGGLWD